MAEFEAGLDRYGADLSRWPPEIRAAGEALFVQSAEAKAAWHDARLVDEFLLSRADTSPPGELVERVMAAQRAHDSAHPEEAISPLRMPWPRVLQAALLCCIVLLIGVVAGDLAASKPADFDASGIFLVSSDQFYI
ncbi:hypothetical protein [Dongia sp.]|uniref:hypothetical protein n=1 Tax=Dongia sp. TaxID=1977262 RepID=UPI0035B4D814